jgi:ribosomal protein S20
VPILADSGNGLPVPWHGGIMTINPISAAGLSQYVLASSNSSQVKQGLQTLQNNLASGDLSDAQSAFQSLQQLLQDSATAAGSSLSSDSQLSTDLTALGSALTAGDLSTAQSAFATVQSDLKSSSSPVVTNEISAASQSVQLVDQLLNSVNSSSTSSTTPAAANSILESVYGSGKGLNVLA